VAFAIVLNPPDFKVRKELSNTVQRTSVCALRPCKLKGAGTLTQAGKCRNCREKWQFLPRGIEAHLARKLNFALFSALSQAVSTWRTALLAPCCAAA
jgi:hypothetical protein